MIEFVISVLSLSDILERLRFGFVYTQVVGVRYFEVTPFVFAWNLRQRFHFFAVSAFCFIPMKQTHSFLS